MLIRLIKWLARKENNRTVMVFPRLITKKEKDDIDDYIAGKKHMRTKVSWLKAQKVPCAFNLVTQDTEVMKAIKCNFKQCAAGMGVAGNGNCFLRGNPEQVDCEKFVDEEKFLGEQEKR